MSLEIQQRLKKHITELCRSPRDFHAPGYFQAQDYLTEELRLLGLNPQRHHFSTLFCKNATNVFAETHPESSAPRILIGAHYETRDCSGVGADDNASAVAVVLELARILPSLSDRPFTFIFFDLEENFRLNALRGSRTFAKDYAKPLDRVVIMDLVGGDLAPGFESVFLQFGQGLPRLQESAHQFLHLPMLVMEPMGGFFPRSDYDIYRRRKIPFCFVSTGNPWYYHTEFDTPDILNYSKMAGLTQALTESLSKPDLPSPLNKEVGWEDFFNFIKILQKTPHLSHPLFDKLIKEGRPASRFEMLKLHKHVLSTIRKEGPKLWGELVKKDRFA